MTSRVATCRGRTGSWTVAMRASSDPTGRWRSGGWCLVHAEHQDHRPGGRCGGAQRAAVHRVLLGGRPGRQVSFEVRFPGSCHPAGRRHQDEAVTSTADLSHHYGRVRAERDRAVPQTFHWTCSQDGGPGSEALGHLTGRIVGDLGAGSARHAAHLAVHHLPAGVVAVDGSPAQYDRPATLFGHLAPRLRIASADAVRHLTAHPDTYDVLYSVFSAPSTSPTRVRCCQQPQLLCARVAVWCSPPWRTV